MALNHAQMEHMKSKYRILAMADNKAIDKKVDDLFEKCFFDDVDSTSRIIELFVDAMEHQNKGNNKQKQ